MIEKIKNFNWWRILMPFTTYYKLKNGWIHPMLILLDLIILCIPFSTIGVVFIVTHYLND
jgi:hypothetical protein